MPFPLSQAFVLSSIWLAIFPLALGQQAPANPPAASAAADGGCCPHGKLSVKGTNLVGSDGQPVQLRGMSLFWSSFLGEGAPFFNAQTVQCLKCNWHADIVRAPMGVENEGGNNPGYLDASTKEREYAKEEAVVDAAIANCMYVLVDWHLTSNEMHTDEAVEFFKRISAKCAGKCNCLYETYNEPKDQDWSSQMKPYHEKVIQAIREKDKDGVIIAGTPKWDQQLDKAAADPIKDQTNIMYTLHFYAGEPAHQDPLRTTTENAIKAGLPVFVTEYGTTAASGNGTPNFAETKKWYDLLDKNNVSYINWSVGNKDETSAALKPGATPADVCKNDKDTESGAFVKAMLKEKNPPPKNCPAA